MTAHTAGWPVVSLDEARAILTAPGAPFEMSVARIDGRDMRVYVQALADLRELFDRSLAFGERDFIRFQDERMSFVDHWRAATAFGHALRERFGVRKGDRVAIAMRNFPEWSICAWATMAMGAVLVPLNAWEPGAALADMLRDSGARLVVVDAERADRLAAHAADIPLVSVRDDRVRPGVTPLESIIGAPGSYAALSDDPLPAPGLEPDDDVTLFYTSGTTGRPKGVLGTHRNATTSIISTAYRVARAAVRRGQAPSNGPAKPSGPPRLQLAPLPFFHVTGFNAALLSALWNGATLVLMYKWDVEDALNLIAEHRINVLTLVPSQVLQLATFPTVKARGLDCVDTVNYGGAAGPPELASWVREAFPKAFPGQGYGATECSSVISSNGGEDALYRPNAVGTIVPCCDVRVVGVDGAEVESGGIGELWVRGASVVRGYWNAPEATAESFVDGWYRTGDIGRVDEEGFIILLDRAKDMLIRGGENIYCVEIEDVLAVHPAVAEVAVIGVPDPVLGETVGAIVRLRPGAAAAIADLMAHAADRLPAHKRPTLLRLRDEPLPRNAAGKVLKRDLRDELLAAPQPPAAARSS